MRAWVAAIPVLACGCGGQEAGFRIDQVTIKPNDLPLSSTSSEDVRISAQVFDDRHEVVEVLVLSDEAMLWVDMVPGRYPKWSARVPVADFSGYAIGEYWIDIQAQDDADRTVVLEDAVKLTIRED